MSVIYLDYAASTPVKPQVINVFNKALTVYGNPSSMHQEGRKAKRIIDNTKKIIANKINCLPEEIFFTSGATMSNSILIQGYKNANPNGHLYTSTIEHNDIQMLCEDIEVDKPIFKVHNDGIINAKLMFACEKNDSLFSIQMANSETGVIQPIKRIGSFIKTYGLDCYLHMDATQYIPYYPIDVKDMNIDALSMSGQKIGGIKGSGILYISKELQEKIKPTIYGEQGLIGGTPSTPLIASLGEAFQLIDYDIEELQNKRDFLLSKLEDIGGILIGSREHRLPNNIYIRFPGINGMTLMNLLDDYDICVGTGSACSTESDKPSHVALAYGLTSEEALECIRFSLGHETTYDELNYVAQVVKRLIQTLR